MKRIVFLIGIILILAACNSPSQNDEIEENNREQTDLGNNDESTSEPNNIREEDEGGASDNNGEGDTNLVENEDEQDKISSDNKGNEKSTEDQLVDLTYNIFAAQRNLDYDYLESVLSEGSTLDKDKKMFTFNNVKYPHEQELLDEVQEDHLEYRYINDENEDYIIVGFAAIDYENESSFTIDFQYIKENGEWKMNDMDVNK